MTTISSLLDGAATDPAVDPQEPNTPPSPDPNAANPQRDPADPADPQDPNEPQDPAGDDPQEGDDPQDPADPAGDDDTDSIDPEQFFQTLDQIYGEDINSQIDYGDVDPLSPEGVYKREQYMLKRGADQFENYLKTSDPRGYAYFLHRKNGGSDETFFDKPSFVLPDLQEVKDSVDLQRKVYQMALKGNGLSDKKVESLIKIAIEEGTLAADSEAAWKEIREKETKQFQKAEEENARRLEKQNKDLTNLDTAINKIVTSGDGLKFIIPDADKPKFSQAFKELIHYEDGQFFLVKPLGSDNIAKALEAELFEYLGGDLKKLVERKATTVASRRIIKKAGKSGAPPQGGGTPNGVSTISDIL